MSDNKADLIAQVTDLRRAAASLDYPDSYRTCMMAASELVEEAAFCLTRDKPGRRVAELLLLSARLEDLSETDKPNLADD